VTSPIRIEPVRVWMKNRPTRRSTTKTTPSTPLRAARWPRWPSQHSPVAAHSPHVQPRVNSVTACHKTADDQRKHRGKRKSALQHRRQELADSQMASAQPSSLSLSISASNNLTSSIAIRSRLTKSCSSCLAVTLATHELALNLGPRTNFNPRSLQFSPPPCRLIETLIVRAGSRSF
jgi:hypothetical protein